MVRYNVGDIILQQSWSFGQRYIRITNKDNDIKNGSSGFDGVLCDKRGNEVNKDDKYGNTVWGYDTQILKVVDPNDEEDD